VRGEVVPLRPLTLSEILDAAVELLRRHASRMLVFGAIFAVLEQALLFPLRGFAAVSPPLYWPHLNRLGAYWLLFSVGLGTEVAIIALLGGLAARAVVPALGLQAARPPRRTGALIALAVMVGLAGTLTAAAGYLPWIVWYLFTGLAAPALIVEQRGPLSALGRSFALVGRGGLRPGFIRLLGYLAWWTIRLALAAGGQAVLELTGQLSSGFALRIAGIVAWAMVNTIAYPALGCLDVVLHLENRMRVEGLDLALGGAVRRGLPTDPILTGRVAGR
jgi:hypothetical protein